MSNIYLVTVHTKDGQQSHLVRAKTRAAARSFIAGQWITARLPSQDELVQAATDGARVVDSDQPAPEQPNQDGNHE